MDVEVLVYLERGEEGQVWCAESPDVPGFYAAEDALQALLVRAELAVRDVLDGRAESVHFRLVGAVPASEGVETTTSDEDERAVGPQVVATSLGAA